MNMLGSKMKIPLSNNVVLSIMVVLFLTSIALGVIMLISILLYCTSFDGYIPTSNTSPSFTSLYANAYLCLILECIPDPPGSSWASLLA